MNVLPFQIGSSFEPPIRVSLSVCTRTQENSLHATYSQLSDLLIQQTSERAAFDPPRSSTFLRIRWWIDF